MLQPYSNGEIPLHSAIKAAVDVLETKVVTSSRDEVGVCFFGTKQQKNFNNFEGIYEYFSLEEPDGPRVMQLESLLLDNDPASFHQQVGSGEADFVLAYALWCCSSMFQRATSRGTTRRIFLFTNDADPNAGNPESAALNCQRAQDLFDLNIEIFPFLLLDASQDIVSISNTTTSSTGDCRSHQHRSHNDEKKMNSDFFRFLYSLYHQGATLDAFHLPVCHSLSELEDKCRTKAFYKRPISRYDLCVGDARIGIAEYALFMPGKKPAPVKLDRRTNFPTATETRYIATESGQQLLPSMCRYASSFGHAPVIFSEQELRQIKGTLHLGAPSLQWIGTTPQSAIQINFRRIRSPHFLSADETSRLGSRSALAALHAALQERQAALLCWWIPRRVAIPRLAALIPSSPSASHFGLHLYPLPFAEEIRPVQSLAPDPLVPDEKAVALAKGLIRKLRVKNFDCSRIPNANLATFQGALSAVALNRDLQQPSDQLERDDAMFAMVSNEAISFRESAWHGNYTNSLPLKASSSRSSASGRASVAGQSAPSKKRKATESVDADVIEGYRQKIHSGVAETLTVEQLKAVILQSDATQHLSKLKKADLVQLAKNCCRG